MGLVPWCKGCAHESKGAFCDPCGKCCMGNEFVKKEDAKSSIDFVRIFDNVRHKLETFACVNKLKLETSNINSHGRLIGPFMRRFVFTDPLTTKSREFIVDFTQVDNEWAMINNIISNVKDNLLQDYRGSATYLTTRNPYLDRLKNEWMAKYQQEPIRPLEIKTCENCGHRKEDVDDPKSHCYRCDLSCYTTNPSEWVPKHDDRAYVMRKMVLYKMYMDAMYGANKEVNMNRVRIMDVIFNGPATIVIWSDKTKTVVKAQDGEKIDYEKGLAMAISKKFLGNKGNYYDQFNKWLKNAPVVKKTKKTVKKDK